MQRLDVGETLITVHITRTDSYQRLPTAQRIIRQIRTRAIASSQARLQYVSLGTRLHVLA